ncbi:hypothetical protein AK812_SmicGene343 [Symbiodinium microadriaticum]|uniref:Uncharacterized protein n=1 Tax=Symbiodinium microadriaticum TaxID=2951 RepID=A0A1Q9F6Y5_SYMMI|nr:hypothetical protein AK812_SmicGene343 [Symbiodinium microadriaticum]
MRADVPASIQRLREAPVHQILRCCRRVGSAAEEAYPELYPLSALLLSLRRLLRGRPRAGRRQGVSSVVQIAGVPPQLLEPPSPLLPFAAGQAQATAARARALRRWLKERANTQHAPWEAALMLLVQNQVTGPDVELWAMALAVPVQEVLRAAAEDPRSDWVPEAYALIGREDLALLAGSEAVADSSASSSRRMRDLLEGADEDFLATTCVDPMESADWYCYGGYCPNQNKARLGQVEEGYSVSSSELIQTQSERFEEALFTSNGDEIRDGSLPDACLFIGLPTLSKWDSVLAGFLLLLNIFTQIGFVGRHLGEQDLSAFDVGSDEATMLPADILQPDQLTNLLRFRTNVAHDVKYADLVGGRSMARMNPFSGRMRKQDWAFSGTKIPVIMSIVPVEVISDLNDYISELFNIMGFVSAIRSESTLMAAGEEDDSSDAPWVINGVCAVRMSRELNRRLGLCFRGKSVLFLFVALPRLMVAVALAITGTRYLANTLSLADLILNAVALAFILDGARFLLDALGTLPIARVEIPGQFVKPWCALYAEALNAVQDFIYTAAWQIPSQVNAATGLVEATPTFSDNVSGPDLEHEQVRA